MPSSGATTGTGARRRSPLRPGTAVEVRSRFDGSWASGFEVADVEEAGYIIRRTSDGSLLPVPLPLDDVRRERRRETWWV